MLLFDDGDEKYFLQERNMRISATDQPPKVIRKNNVGTDDPRRQAHAGRNSKLPVDFKTVVKLIVMARLLRKHNKKSARVINW